MSGQVYNLSRLSLSDMVEGVDGHASLSANDAQVLYGEEWRKNRTVKGCKKPQIKILELE